MNQHPANPAQPQLSQENIQLYNKMKQEYAQIFKVFIELEDEKREHVLVLDTIKDLESTRRCWRLVGGVLIERNIGEVLPAIKSNIDMLEKTIVNYSDNLKLKEKELLDFELKYGLATNKAATNAQKESDLTSGEEKKNTGVLA